MIRTRLSSFVVVALAAALTGSAAHAQANPSVVGTYKLVKRVLVDGTEITPPDVVGLNTYSKTHRNMNVSWKDGDRRVSVSFVSGYRLNVGQYCEQPIYWMQNNYGEDGVKYEWPEDKGECTPVLIEDGYPTFAPSGEIVVLRFSKSGFTATAEGRFDDHWERVD